MKKFTIPCEFGEEKTPFALYIGEPATDSHPLYYQNRWMIEERGGRVPEEVMESFAKLHKISLENEVGFEELCMYALGQAAEEKKTEIEKGGQE